MAHQANREVCTKLLVVPLGSTPVATGSNIAHGFGEPAERSMCARKRDRTHRNMYSQRAVSVSSTDGKFAPEISFDAVVKHTQSLLLSPDDQDNTIVVLAQTVVFTWAFMLMLRGAGVFRYVGFLPPTAVGALLVIATCSVLCYALWIMLSEVRVNEKRRRDEAASSNAPLTVEEEPPEESPRNNALPTSDAAAEGDADSNALSEPGTNSPNIELDIMANADAPAGLGRWLSAMQSLCEGDGAAVEIEMTQADYVLGEDRSARIETVRETEAP